MNLFILIIEEIPVFKGEILECIHAAIDSGYTRLLKTNDTYTHHQMIDEEGKVAIIELDSTN